MRTEKSCDASITMPRAGQQRNYGSATVSVLVFNRSSRPTVRPTQPPIPWVLGDSFLVDKSVGA
jgi:hypothetical protein